MSNKSKGNKYENEVKAILEREGFKVQKAQPQYRFIAKNKIISRNSDLFNVWDGIAVADGIPCRFYQVTVWEAIAPRRKKCMDFPMPMGSLGIIYARRRDKGKAHYRLLYHHDDYQWTGESKMVKGE